MASKILQYVIVRKDLIPAKRTNQTSFSTGAIIAQACHAATAAVFKTLQSQATHDYLASLEDMTVCVLSVDSDSELKSLAEIFYANNIPHHLWLEKPELIVTALATAPLEKSRIHHLVEHLKLLR